VLHAVRHIFFVGRGVKKVQLDMCHFDPASEDDMDDSGMSRYMDSNDEEGWE